MAPHRLAVLNSHVIQYYAPLYRRLAEDPEIDLTVYYCSRQGLDAYADAGFGGQQVQWDVPLLEGYRAVFLENWRRGKRVEGFWSLINPGIINELRHHRYDALWVHGHNYATHLIACAAARLLEVPFFTRGDTTLFKQRTKFWRWLHRAMLRPFYRQCAGCLAVGSRNAEYYRYYGVPDRKIFLVPFTVDNARFMELADTSRSKRHTIRAELGLSPKLPVLLFASKFTHRKRPLDVLRAKAALQQEGLEFSVLMVGAGEEEDALREYCREKDLRDVLFIGFCNQSELPRLYALADVFVLPSENEPWGLVINEVMCAGVAIVATEETGSVPDLVQQGDNGLLYPAGDVVALSAILRELLREPRRCHRMGQRSREIIANWSYDQCLQGVKMALKTT